MIGTTAFGRSSSQSVQLYSGKIVTQGKCNDKKASQCNVTKCVYKVMIDVMVNLEIVTIDIPPRPKAYPPPIVGTKLQMIFKFQ